MDYKINIYNHQTSLAFMRSIHPKDIAYIFISVHNICMSTFTGVSVFQKVSNYLMILSDVAPFGIAVLRISFLLLL